MKKDTTSLGTQGESAACDYLESIGTTVKERNFRTNGGEIDIVAHDGEYTVFVEVKTRTALPSSRYGRASDAVNKAKRARFVHAASEYLKTHPEVGKCRIDVIEVYFPSGSARAEVRHVRSAFGADG